MQHKPLASHFLFADKALQPPNSVAHRSLRILYPSLTSHNIPLAVSQDDVGIGMRCDAMEGHGWVVRVCMGDLSAGG